MHEELKYNECNMQVVRGGERKTVSIHDLVVGDIVPLSIGGQVCPADFPKRFSVSCILGVWWRC